MANLLKFDKSLAGIGFFTPANGKTNIRQSKKVVFTATRKGRRYKSAARIVPGAIYRLPTTSDQDKYLGLLKIAADMKRQNGRVSNPLRFTAARILGILGRYKRSGRNYRLIEDWLNVMAATTVISDEAVYLAGRKLWVRDRLRVLARAESVGYRENNGATTDRHSVWLSEWQIENLNNNHVITVDLDTYLRLRKPIAKALVPFLHIWMFACRREGYFVKSYQKFCRLFSLCQYTCPSAMRQKLAPSMEELVCAGYLSDWDIGLMKNGTDYKIIMCKGKQLPARERDIGSSPGDCRQTQPATHSNSDPALVEEMIKRGIPAARAAQFAARRSGGHVMDQLEWGDHCIERKNGPAITNPTGFYIHLIQENVQPPESFQTSRRRQIDLQKRHQAEEESGRKAKLELEYENFITQQVEIYIEEHYSQSEYRRLEAQKRNELALTYPEMIRWTRAVADRFVRRALHTEIEEKLYLPSFESYCRQSKSKSDSPQ